MGLNLYLVNESTALSDDKAKQIAWAIDYQLKYHYGRSGWRTDARCFYLGDAGSVVPKSFPWEQTALLHALDSSDVQGALGYHDEDGQEVPYAKFFVKTALLDAQQPSEVASHEALELCSDPHVNLTAPTGDLKRLYAVEVGDPCQGNGYDVGAPEGKTTGVIVADFALPGWFDPSTPATTATDYRGALRGPFALGPQGYYAYIDLANVAGGWQQQVGTERTAPVGPDRDDRIGRR